MKSCGSCLTSTLAKPASCEHLLGQLLAPHRAEARAALGQRDRHAVHGRDGVQERPERVVHVVVDVAGARDVLHQVDAVVAQGLGDALEHRRRLGLVVDRVEGGDEVVARPPRRGRRRP